MDDSPDEIIDAIPNTVTGAWTLATRDGRAHHLSKEVIAATGWHPDESQKGVHLYPFTDDAEGNATGRKEKVGAPRRLAHGVKPDQIVEVRPDLNGEDHHFVFTADGGHHHVPADLMKRAGFGRAADAIGKASPFVGAAAAQDKALDPDP